MKRIFTLALLILLIQVYSAYGQVTYVTTDAPQELTNKTLTSPVIKGTPIMDAGLNWNMGGAAHSTPATVGVTLPSTCSLGNEHFLTTEKAGENKYLCVALNTWVKQATGGAGGGGATTV